MPHTSCKSSYMYPKCYSGNTIYPPLLHGKVWMGGRICNTAFCGLLCIALCCFHLTAHGGSRYRFWPCYLEDVVFREKRWQLSKWNYSFNLYVSKKIWICFEGSAQISGNQSLGLDVLSLPSRTVKLAGRLVSWFPWNIIDLTWLSCLLPSSINMGIMWQQFWVTPFKFTWAGHLFLKKDQVYLICHSSIHIWVSIPSEISCLDDL